MNVKYLGKALLFGIAVSSAQTSTASGLRLPETSMLSYAFTCGSGASGQVSYVRSSPNGTHRQLVLMVNGRHFENEPRLVALLKDKSIDSVGSGCEGDSTVVHFQTWADRGDFESGTGTLSIRIDEAGKVLSIGT
jgi:hypothetical protein